jgi:hypothetical protein
MIPLRSYDNPPNDDQFAELDSFEFHLNNVRLSDEAISPISVGLLLF